MVVRFSLVLVLFGIACAADPPNPDGRAPPAQVSGSLAQILEPKNAKTSDKHVAHASNSILLWCGAKPKSKDSKFMKISSVRLYKFPNGNAPLSEATEVTGDVPSEVAANNTVSFNLGHAPVTAAGKYRVDLLNNDAIVVTGNMFVYMRPVFVQEEYQHLYLNNEDNIFELEGGGQTIYEGGSVSLSCRAVGYPKINYQWIKYQKENEIQLKSDTHYTINNEVLTITDVSEDHRAVYKCIATNSFEVNKVSQKFSSSVAFNIRIKSTLAWLWPLITLIVTALLLVTIVFVCEYFRKKQEEKDGEKLEPEKED